MKYFLFFIFLYFIIGKFSYAQQTLIFRDNFGVQGEFSYKGELVDSLKLNNGRFNLKWREIQQDTLTTFNATGEFLESLPSGLWTWEQAGWDYSIEPSKSIKPSFNLTGNHEVWRGSFIDGFPNGKWVYASGSPEINKSSLRAPLRIETNYKNGLLSGNFKITDLSNEFPIKITGSCSENGIAIGTWRYEYNKNGSPIVEERTFSDGVLTHLKISSKNPYFLSEKTFDRNIEYLAQIRDSNNTNIIIGSRNFYNDGYDSYSSELISNYFNNHVHKYWQLNSFPYTQNGDNPIFKRFCFPLNETEANYRESITHKSNNIKRKIEEVFELGNILINRKRSLELDLSISFLEKAQQQLVVLDSILESSYEEDFIYHDRVNGDLKHLLKQINLYALAFPENYDSEPIVLPKIQVKRDIFDFFLILNEFISELDKEILKYIDVLEDNSIAIRKESEIRKLENKLENDWSTLDSLYSDLKGTGEHVYSYWIKTYLSNKIKDYANLEEYETAISQGNVLLSQMDSLVIWYGEVVAIDSFIYEIDDFYKQMAYNPYTGKYDISLPLKRRFSSILKTVILPHMLEELMIHEKWSSFQDSFLQLKQFKADAIRFALLNEKQDGRIEKRLRKETNPEKFVRIFLDYMESR